MTTPRDPDRLISAFLGEGAEQLRDQVYDAVRADIDHRRQRVVIGPWRTPDVTKFFAIGLGAATVVVALVIGTQVLGPPPPSGIGGAPSASPSTTPFGGTVEYRMNGALATTEVDAVADGGSVSGTAVTTVNGGTHTVQLECGARDGDIWVLGGTTEQSTIPGEPPGTWSVVLVKEGSPQQIGIWFSGEPSEGNWCEEQLSEGLSSFGPEYFTPVESGALVPLPDLAH